MNAKLVLFIVLALILSACGGGGASQASVDALATQVANLPMPQPVPPTATPIYTATITAMAQAAAETPTAAQSPATATPVSSAAPARSVESAYAAPVEESSGCLTDSDVMSLFGFPAGEVVRTDAPWDTCKWNRQVAATAIVVTLPTSWGLTYTDPQGNVWVTLGDGQQVTVRGFTLRQPGNQILSRGPQGYFEFEWGYGFASERGSATFPSCPDTNLVGMVTLTSDQQAKCAAQNSRISAPTVAVPTRAFPDCPSDDLGWYSSNIGGNVEFWTKPDWAGGAWVFKDKGNPVSLKYPGSGKLDVWIGSGPVEITATNAGQLTGKTFDEASFHCK